MPRVTAAAPPHHRCPRAEPRGRAPDRRRPAEQGRDIVTSHRFGGILRQFRLAGEQVRAAGSVPTGRGPGRPPTPWRRGTGRRCRRRAASPAAASPGARVRSNSITPASATRTRTSRSATAAPPRPPGSSAPASARHASASNTSGCAPPRAANSSAARTSQASAARRTAAPSGRCRPNAGRRRVPCRPRATAPTTRLRPPQVRGARHPVQRPAGPARQPLGEIGAGRSPIQPTPRSLLTLRRGGVGQRTASGDVVPARPAARPHRPPTGGPASTPALTRRPGDPQPRRDGPVRVGSGVAPRRAASAVAVRRARWSWTAAARPSPGAQPERRHAGLERVGGEARRCSSMFAISNHAASSRISSAPSAGSQPARTRRFHASPGHSALGGGEPIAGSDLPPVRGVGQDLQRLWSPVQAASSRAAVVPVRLANRALARFAQPSPRSWPRPDPRAVAGPSAAISCRTRSTTSLTRPGKSFGGATRDLLGGRPVFLLVAATPSQRVHASAPPPLRVRPVRRLPPARASPPPACGRRPDTARLR